MSEQINPGYYVDPETGSLFEYSGDSVELNLPFSTYPQEAAIEQANIADFFTAVDRIALDIERQRQVKDVLDYLIVSGNPQLIAPNIDDFLARMNHETLALKLINNSLWGIVENNLDKFDDPGMLKRLAPGLGGL